MKRSFWHFLASHRAPPAHCGDTLVRATQVGLVQEARYARAKFGLTLAATCMGSLLLCPQFGMGAETPLYHLAHKLMHTWGDWACALYCAFLFMGITTFLATLVLRPNEILLLGRRSFFFLSGMAAGGFGLLMGASSLGLANDALATGRGLAYNAIWLAGAILLAQLAHHAAGRLRIWQYRR